MAKTHSPGYYTSVASKNDLEVVEGSKHTKIYATTPQGDKTVMMIPRHGTLSKGVECNIKKWFAMLGISICIGMCAYIAILAYIGSTVGF